MNRYNQYDLDRNFIDTITAPDIYVAIGLIGGDIDDAEVNDQETEAMIPVGFVELDDDPAPLAKLPEVAIIEEPQGTPLEDAPAPCDEAVDNPQQVPASNKPILKFFEYAHLPDHLAELSAPFHGLAHELDSMLSDNEEKEVGLRKLLEAKDCFVRAALG